MRHLLVFGTVAALLIGAGCSQAPKEELSIRKMPAGQQYSGFLSSYANLKTNPRFVETVCYLAETQETGIQIFEINSQG